MRSIASVFARSVAPRCSQNQNTGRTCVGKVPDASQRTGRTLNFCSATASSHFPHNDADLDALSAKNDRPMLLSVGAHWSAKSRAVAERVSEWVSTSHDAKTGVVLAFADIDAAPRLVEERHIRTVPTVLLLRNGKTERRADGGDSKAIEAILTAAESYNKSDGTATASSTCLAIATADELLERNASVEGMDGEQVWLIAESSYRSALEDASDSAFAFRARLGLLRCALLRASAVVMSDAEQSQKDAVDKAASLMEDLYAKHSAEVEVNERADAALLSCFLGHAQLLLDAWQGTSSCEEEQHVLNIYAAGNIEEALMEALVWYQTEALTKMEGLVEAYCLPDRRLSDRDGDVPSTSIYANEAIARDVGELPVPSGARALLRRLFAALGPRSEHVAKARAELEFLLDRKRWVPFHTRQLVTRRGGMPHGGRGTGSGDGFSRKYWIAYGPERAYKNTKPMGGPHTNSYEGW